MDPRVLNLSAFGEVIKNPKDVKQVDVEEPQRALPPPSRFPTPADFSDLPFVKNSKKEDDEVVTKYGRVTQMVLQNMAQTKLLHWQSMLYGQHKALNGLFDSIIEIGDTLIETLMGKYGRPVLTGEELTIKLYNFANAKDGDLSGFIDDLYKCYRDECRACFDSDSDSELINIIDEMLAAVDQTKYLISLR
jgi:hypothetical protein